MKTNTFLSILLILLATLYSCNQSFKEIKKSAEQGDADAQMKLAFMYFDGAGVKKALNNLTGG